MKITSRVLALTSLLLLIVPLAAAQTYTITDLGTFSGGAVSQGQGINLLGQVAGYARFANYNAHGFLWTKKNGLKDLGAIPPASNFSVGQAINFFGEVAGYSDYGALLQEHAVLWSKGKIIDLGTLPGGRISTAYGINDRGQITGFSDSGSNSPHAVLWEKGQAARDLGTLPGGYYSQGLAINFEGSVAGFSNATGGQWHGALWTKSQSVQELPDLTGASSASANGMQDLNSLIDSNSGWQLTSANAINDLGQITGEGTINGQTHAFLLTPTSP
jgi:probable HAF family extracellular repeat protein